MNLNKFYSALKLTLCYTLHETEKLDEYDSYSEYTSEEMPSVMCVCEGGLRF